MHWIIIALGAVLAVVGGGSLYSGMNMLGEERGNVLAISGSVVVAGGMIVLALGLLLKRLETLAARIGTQPGHVVRPLPASPQHPAPPVQAAGEKLIQPDTATPGWAVRSASGRLPEPAAAPPDFLLRPEVAAPQSSRAETGKPRPDALVMSMLEETSPQAAPLPVLPPHRPAAAARPEAPAVVPAPPVALPPSPPAAALQPADLPASVLPAKVSVLPPFQAAVAASPPEPARLFPARQSTLEAAPADVLILGETELLHSVTADHSMHDDHSWFVPQAHDGEAQVDAALPHEVEANAPPAPAPALRLPAAPYPAPSSAETVPEVIGRYNAGGAAYVMYSDGSIEAETEAGTYRFESMAELRLFIEQRTIPAA